MDRKASVNGDFNLEDALVSGGSNTAVTDNDKEVKVPRKDFSWVEPFNPEDDKVKETVTKVEYFGTGKK